MKKRKIVRLTKPKKRGRPKGAVGSLKGAEDLPWYQREEALRNGNIEYGIMGAFLRALQEKPQLEEALKDLEKRQECFATALKEARSLADRANAIRNSSAPSVPPNEVSDAIAVLKSVNSLQTRIKESRRRAQNALRSHRNALSRVHQAIEAGHAEIVKNPSDAAAALAKADSGSKSEKGQMAARLMGVFGRRVFVPIRIEAGRARIRATRATKDSKLEDALVAHLQAIELEARIEAIKRNPACAKVTVTPQFWKRVAKIPDDRFADVARMAGLDCLVGKKGRPPSI